MTKYDLIVVGGGAAGITASRGPASMGWKVAMIEKEYMGGTCTNVGCMPTKALLSSAHFLHQSKHADLYGAKIDRVSADWMQVRTRMDQFVKKLRSGSEKYPTQFENMTLYRGEAAFTGPGTVRVNGDELSADKIIIAAGARSFIPPVPGIEDVDYLTSTTALSLAKLPDHITILGGGVLAAEFAQIFSRLGSKVTILEQNEQILGNFDDDVATEFERLLKLEGIDVLTGHTVKSLSREDAGVGIVLEHDNITKDLSVDAVMIATGRKPNSDLLDCQAAGIELDDRGFIITDESFLTTAQGVWALGDIIGGSMFTHKARHDGMLLSKHLTEGIYVDLRGRIIPFAVFTDPEIAMVGESEKSATQKGTRFVSKKLPYNKIGRAGASSKTDGFIKLLADPDSQKIIGSQIIGENAGEIIHTVTMAMRMNAVIADLQDMMPIHPTFAEGLYSNAMLFKEM